MQIMNSLRTNILTARSIHLGRERLREAPKNLKGKKISSQIWLMRQIRDPYVEMARQEKYRCRSAFKLLEMNERFHFLTSGQTVVDCGAAPGSWTQVAVKMTNADRKEERSVGTVISIDKQPIYPIEGATVLGNTDFTLAESHRRLLELLKGDKVDVVLSDMAPNASGVSDIDHEEIIKLAYSAFKFALQVSKTDGTLVVKIWDGGRSRQLEQDLLKFYKSVKNVRPEATRDESTEKFILARGFKGVKNVPSGAK